MSEDTFLNQGDDCLQVAESDIAISSLPTFDQEAWDSGEEDRMLAACTAFLDEYDALEDVLEPERSGIEVLKTSRNPDEVEIFVRELAEGGDMARADRLKQAMETVNVFGRFTETYNIAAAIILNKNATHQQLLEASRYLVLLPEESNIGPNGEMVSLRKDIQRRLAELSNPSEDAPGERGSK